MAAAEANQPHIQWEGAVTAKLRNPTADIVWSLLEDFCNFHKWFPTIDTCHRVEGADGLVRYCGGGQPVQWCHEKLLSTDPIGKCMSYEVTENNVGIKAYKSTMRVTAIDGGGCQIHWSFVSDPIGGLSQEGFVAYLQAALEGMARNMENAF